jgi:hypothetical protein
LRLSIIASLVVLLMVAAGIVQGFGPTWHYLTDGVTALAVLSLAWAVQRRWQRNAMRTAAQIGELLKLLRIAKSEFSRAEIQAIVAELERMQFDVLKRAPLRR